ncbi:MAG TPA: hypothetical protein VE046_06430 [Steroidobacteraceae bacterium]|nr:hypothetical protein [Steroidobacteraceae bacterium]
MLKIQRLLRPTAAALIASPVGWLGSTAGAAGFDTANVRYIDSWSSDGRNTVIVHTLGHDYRAELLPGCIGIDTSIGVRFVPSGHFNDEFDRFGHLRLSDGTRCYLKSFEEIPRAKR